MGIQAASVTTTASIAVATSVSTKTVESSKSTVKQASTKTSDKQDAYVKSDETTTKQAVTYKQPEKLSAQELQKLNDQRIASFQNMLKSMITKQGQTSNLTMFGQNFTVSQSDSAMAAASLAEGGEWSVDAVAGRIMDMAKALANGDESKISVLRDAVQKGFDAAGKAWGGKLPSICNDTYDEVMKRFDDWEKGDSTTTEE